MWGEKATLSIFFFSQVMVASGCLQNPAAGFWILFSRVGNRTQGPTHAKITLCTELHPVSKQYAAQIWLEAVKTCHNSGPGSKDACLTLGLLEKLS